MVLFKNKLLKYFLFVSIGLVNTQYSFGQTAAEIMEQAESKAYNKDFAGAEELLTIYTENNDDLQALRFHAQVLYWMQNFKRAAQVHEKLQKLYPEINEVKLDYGRFLYETGKIGSSEKILTDYLVKDPDHAEANIMLAYLNIWNGRMRKAREIVLGMNRIYPENKEFNVILEEIDRLRAPILNIAGIKYSDDQPLRSSGLHFSGSWYKSRFFFPTLQFRKRSFSSFEKNYATTWLEAGNIIYLKSKTTLKFKGGVFIPSSSQNSSFTIGLSLKQQLNHSLSFNFDYEETPYQYTTSSILEPFLHTSFKASLKLENKNGLLGDAGHQQQIFPDDNAVKASYLWIVFPLLKKHHLKINAGYSFNFSSSDKSTFTVEESSSGGEIGFSPVVKNPTEETEGSYNLYFTPKNQVVNSLLSSLRIGSDETNFNLKLNLGLLSSADVPIGETTSALTYYKVNYIPLEIEGSINIGINKQFILGGQYNYQSLFFFKNHTAGLQLTYKFLR